MDTRKKKAKTTTTCVSCLRIETFLANGHKMHHRS
jgi:hypothetical protein